MEITTIVFDFGGVLIDWNPRHLFRKVFSDAQEMETFLAAVCTDDWNVQQDKGRTLKDGTAWLVERFPAKKEWIEQYYGRWTEMLNGTFEGSLEILSRLRGYYRLYGLTNWSAETYPVAYDRFDFLKWFDGIVVSGHEGVIKPDPAIFELLKTRYDVVPGQSVFIDDNIRNVEAAKALGFHSIHFQSPTQLARELEALGVQY